MDNLHDRFAVAYVCRADLQHKGYDVSHVTDDDMERIASKIGDFFLDESFWSILVDVVDEMEIPKTGEKKEITPIISEAMVKELEEITTIRH